MRKLLSSFFAFVIFPVLLLSCARAPIAEPKEALRPAPAAAAAKLLEISDDLELESFRTALSHQVRLLESGRGPSKYVFGKLELTRSEYLEVLRPLQEAAARVDRFELLLPFLRANFSFHEVYGNSEWGKVLVTGYYESRLKGSKRKTERFYQPLYGRPPALKEGEVFFSREDIDSKKVLAGQGLELCYVDPLDATIIQTQGSGIIEFEDGSTLRLAFAGKNHRPFTPIGKYVREKLKIKHAFFDSVESYLRQLPQSEMRKILNTNESYVFFEPNTFGARTSMGIPATAGRTVAIDPKLFPKGGIGFLIFNRPTAEVGETNRVGRFVIAQDVGTAIKGPARVDLFIGEGEAAKFEAGRLKSDGLFYFLVPKDRPKRMTQT